ncbi:MAG: DNA-binding protein [Eubacterium sp.]|nr:DNA-binding protein [Eubacterium sp.]
MYKNLSDVLKAEGITQKEYGVLLGISEKSITNKISGVTEFTYSEFKKTMLLLKKYNADFLFAESNPKSA